MFCCFDFFFDTRRFKLVYRLKIVLKAVHAGDAGAPVADVVDDFVGSAENFAGCAVEVCDPRVRQYYPEHWLAPGCVLIPLDMPQPLLLSFSGAVMALHAPTQKANCYPIPASGGCLSGMYL